MMTSFLATLLATASLFGLTLAQYFPPTPAGITTLKSKLHDNTFICETTPGVHSYSGYIHLPPDTDMSRNYPINMFFWFFESRKDPCNAPLAIWLNGGPGAFSTASALGENGPCIVSEDSNSTTLNPWSWNNEVNMLYIDQPVQVGFSYDILANSTLNALSTTLLPVIQDFSVTGVPEQNETFFVGTFPSLDSSSTANSTGNAAPAVWSFLQIWFDEFPFYKPPENQLSVWAESYGGHWGPGVAAYIEQQNDKIEAGSLKGASIINLDAVGIINGGIDFSITANYYPDMAYNNTYGFQAITEAEFDSATANLTTCKALINSCQELAAVYDPDNYGNNATVNSACSAGYGYCYLYVEAVYSTSGHDAFDIGHTTPDPTPLKYEIGFLNQHWVQAALGVPVNFTYQNMVVYNSVMAEGDITRGGFLEALADLLDRGVQVALMYGDRDYIGNWIGGERASLAINSTTSAGFAAAGYANITTNSSYVGGVVRQHGGLSFSRVFDAAHGVPYYQPETAYQIFNRVIGHTDISSGEKTITPNYSTTGPKSSFQIKNEMPVDPKKVCYTYSVLTTCTVQQIGQLAAGTAVVKNWVVLGYVQGNETIWY